MNITGSIPLARFGDLLPVFILVFLFLFLLNQKSAAVQSNRFELYCADSLIFSDTLHDSVFRVDTPRGRIIVHSTPESVSLDSVNCPEKICEHSHPISKSGESIICIPNRFVLKMVGERSDGADIIAR